MGSILIVVFSITYTIKKVESIESLLTNYNHVVIVFQKTSSDKNSSAFTLPLEKFHEKSILVLPLYIFILFLADAASVLNFYSI
jgi:hypothetical protein